MRLLTLLSFIPFFHHSGTDEKRLIKALATKDATARFQIAIKYKDLYGKELVDVVKKECGGEMGLALQYLAAPLNVAESMMIKRACSGTGTNEDVLYPIIVGRTNDEITILKKAYFDEYNKDLTVLIAKETRGDFESILFNCLQGSEEEYDPDYHTDEKVTSDVQEIYNAGQGRTGTNEKKVFKMLCAFPSAHLKKVNLAYADKHGYTLFKALEKVCSMSLELAVDAVRWVFHRNDVVMSESLLLLIELNRSVFFVGIWR